MKTIWRSWRACLRRTATGSVNWLRLTSTTCCSAGTRSPATRLLGGKLGLLFEHLLVDEYQDLNALQVEIVRALRRDQRGLTAVGDDAQAIYGFRAASAEHILNFQQHFPDATVVTLERNYRSTQPILDLANEVSAAAARSYPKRLRADREGGTRPQLVYCRDEAQQAIEVCERVLAQYEQGTALKQQAVLMRAGHHSALLELELSQTTDPVRQVRRHPLPGSRPHQRLRLPAPPGRRSNPLRSARLVSHPPTTGRGRPGPRPAPRRRARPRSSRRPSPSFPHAARHVARLSPASA